MMTTKARAAILGIAVLLLLWTFYQQTYEVSPLVGLLIAYLIWSHFKQGTVALASRAYHDKDYNKAENLLAEIKNPDYLARNRRGYYEFIKANIALQKDELELAEMHFQIASRFPLRNQNDKALVLVQLANLNLRKREPQKAQAYIDVARELKITARVQQIIEKIEKEIQKLS